MVIFHCYVSLPEGILKYSFFFLGGRSARLTYIRIWEDVGKDPSGRGWRYPISPPNIHTCVELQDLSTPQKQSSPIKFCIQSFRFNYSATYIISHPISFSEGEFTNFSVWRCRFSLLFVDYITLLLCGSTHPWGLRDPRAASQTLPRWRVAGAAGAVFYNGWKTIVLNSFDILPYIASFN